MTGWSAWRPVPVPGETPYHDWWRRTEQGSGHPAPEARMRDVVPARALGPATAQKAGKPRIHLGDRLTAPGRPGAWNARFDRHLARQGDWMPPPELLPEVPDGTVMVGVIDADIPLGHARWCDARGRSRIAAAWQMGQPGGQDWLPFGHELYADDIDSHLDATRRGPDGRLDQMAFDLRTGTVDMDARFGRRALIGRYSHGAHVLDAAAGCEPRATGDPMAQSRIIVANLPHRVAFGASGEFLDYYMVHAVRRIIDLSDAIWLRNHPGTSDGRIGYSTVINLSFGRQAGVKDRRGVFTRAIERVLDLRGQDRAPVDIVTPAGNDNLERMYAVARLAPVTDGAAAEARIDWRIQPEDQSSNYVEILFETEIGEGSTRHAPVEIDVVPPGGRPRTRRTRVNAWTLLDGIAAIHCGMDPADRLDGRQLFRILVCVAPTSRPGGTGPCAPSGAWTIRLRNTGQTPLEVDLNIQTDQSVLPGSTAGRRSYLDSPSYRRHDAAGRLLDTAGAEGARPDFDPVANPCVRRHGTINATASGTRVVCLGGYRLSDGCEAPYSSTGAGVALSGDGRSAPTAALPTDDGHAHFGRLAAGAADGSVVAMRGTSFAAPQATRLIALARLKGDVDTPGASLLADMAARDEATAGFPHGRVIAKTGAGRLRSPIEARVTRR